MILGSRAIVNAPSARRARGFHHPSGTMAAMSTTDSLADTVLSGELLAELADLGPCELVEGRIVKTSPTGPRHAKLEQQVAWLLRTFLERHPLGELYVGEIGIYTRRNPDTVRGADIAFVSHERLSAQDPEAPYLTVAPELVVEILSPNDRAQQIETKTREYLGAGTLEVWVVDPENRSVRRQLAERAEISILGEDQTLTMSTLPGLELPVSRIFETLD